MKREFAQSLHCRTCGRNDWDVLAQAEDEREIREGILRCPCGAEFSIRAGVVDFLDPSDELLQKEVQGWTNMAGAQPDWVATQMTALPYYPHDTWLEVGPDFFQIFDHFSFEGKRVIDLGAGRAWSSRHLMTIGRAANVVAIDVLTEKYLGLETSDLFFFDDGIFFERVRADLHRIPLPDAWADVVFSCASLHHSSDLSDLYREADRLLKPGGHFIFMCEPSKAASVEESRPENIETAHGINEHVYSYSEWTQPLRERGFRFRRLVPRSIRHRLIYRTEAFEGRIPSFILPLTRTETGRNLIERLLRSHFVGALLYRYWSIPLTVVAQKPK